MKKLLFLLICVLTFCMVGCGKEENVTKEPTKPYESEIPAEKPVVGYNITFKDKDGNVIKEVRVKENAMPYCEVPFIEGTATTDIEFQGWEPALTKATKDQVYTATYLEVAKKFNCTWVDENGVPIETTRVTMGTVPSHDAYNKEDDAQYSYTFKEWSPVPEAIMSDMTYTAVYDKTVKKYDITWKDAEGNVLKTENVEYGTKPDTAAAAALIECPNGYEVATWKDGSNDIDKDFIVKENVTLTANVDIITRYITFKSSLDNSIILEVPFNVNTTSINEPAVPIQNNYTGTWEAYDLTKLENQVVMSKYEGAKFTVAYVLSDGMTMETMTQEVQLGAEYTLNVPTYNDLYYSFKCWSYDGKNIPTTGKWNIAEDVDLTAVIDCKMSFEHGQQTNALAANDYDGGRFYYEKDLADTQVKFGIARFNNHQVFDISDDENYVTDGEKSLKLHYFNNWNAILFDNTALDYFKKCFEIEGVSSVLFDVYSKGINTRFSFSTNVQDGKFNESLNTNCGGFYVFNNHWVTVALDYEMYQTLSQAKAAGNNVGLVMDISTTTMGNEAAWNEYAVYFDNFRVGYYTDYLYVDFENGNNALFGSYNLQTFNTSNAGKLHELTVKDVTYSVNGTEYTTKALEVKTINHDMGSLAINTKILDYIFTTYEAESISFDVFAYTIDDGRQSYALADGLDLRYSIKGNAKGQTAAGYRYTDYKGELIGTWVTYTYTKDMYLQNKSNSEVFNFTSFIWNRWESTYYIDNFKVNK